MIQVNAQTFKVLFFSPCGSPRQHLDVLEVWLGWPCKQCEWRKMKSSNIQLFSEDSVLSRVGLGPSLHCCTEPLWNWPVDGGRSNVHLPLDGVHSSKHLPLLLQLIPSEDHLNSWIFCIPSQSVQEYSWPSAFKQRTENWELCPSSSIFLSPANTSVQLLPSLTSSNTKLKVKVLTGLESFLRLFPGKCTSSYVLRNLLHLWMSLKPLTLAKIQPQRVKSRNTRNTHFFLLT